MNGRRRRAEKKIRAERPKHLQRACPPALEWPIKSVGGEMRITLLGNKHALVENHHGVEAFSSECIRLHSKGGTAVFHGSTLALGEVRADGLSIFGRIDSVEMPGGEDRD